VAAERLGIASHVKFNFTGPERELMSKPILNVSEAPAITGSSGERFEYSMRSLAHPLGARAIGANVTTVPPGKAGFPIHHHRANEEHFLVLSGTGVLRVGETTYPVRAHDYIVNLPGDAGLAHQLINTGAEDLVYLAISTTVLPEVVGYPDSGKTGVRAAEGPELGTRFLILDSTKNTVAYWDGEDGARVAEVISHTAGTGSKS
jgi:uncharacterized cupin superfamily protein